MFCISSLMFAAAVRMLRASPLNAATTHSDSEVKTWFLLVQGFIVGIITGLFGIGGGFLIVPALYFWSRLSMKAAVGTALLIIAMILFSAFPRVMLARPSTGFFYSGFPWAP